MLRFLSPLFNRPAERSNKVDEALLEKAVERVVLGTDRRIHALGNYQKKLCQPVEQALIHVIALVDALPEPAPISTAAFGEDPRLRALFASAEHLREVLGRFNTVRDFLAEQKGPPPDEIFGLLAMARNERDVFAMELQGDTLRRDVMQVAVDFLNHRFLGPAATEQDSRWELKKRAFDFLIEKALERLMDERGRRRELDRQEHLLKRKLEAMRAGAWGLGSLGDDGDTALKDLATLEAQIAAIEEELGHSHSDNLALEESLASIADTLSRPADWLASREICLRLDYRGIKVPETSKTAFEISLNELFSGAGERRTVMFGRIARADRPEAVDFWKKAKRYL